MTRRRLGDDRGSVVAEFALALPAVVLVLLLGVGALAAGAKQVRLQDAAADAARLLARGEGEDRARAVVVAAAPDAAVSVEHNEDLVCVAATTSAGILGLNLTARSCALAGGL